MKRIVLLLCLLLTFPMVTMAETWSGVPVVDHNCYAKIKADPDSHTTQCALACARSGYGIIASDGTFIKFDENGNKKTIEMLKQTSKKDHLRITVEGKLVGGTIQVQSIKLD
jgi:hypothetical protein